VDTLLYLHEHTMTKKDIHLKAIHHTQRSRKNGLLKAFVTETIKF